MPVFVGANRQGVPTKNVVVKGKSFAQITAEIVKAEAQWTDKLQRSVLSFFANGGEVCFVLLLHDFRNASALKRISGDVARDVPAATLLLIPEMVGNTHTWEPILAEQATGHRLFCLIDLARDRGYAKAALSDFSAELPNDVKRAGAAYWPYLIERSVDGDGMNEYSVPPSAAVAAAIQRTDMAAGVWTAPAGVRLPAVLRLDLEEGETDLYDTGGNTVRFFPGRGALLWGARTLASDMKDAGAYVQTKRTIDFIENGLKAQLRVMLFDVNDALLWRTCEARVTVWLTELWRAGGLSGATAEAAFSVQVGEGVTMTAEDIAEGKLILHVRFSLHPVLADVTLTLTMLQGESHVGVARSGETLVGEVQ